MAESRKSYGRMKDLKGGLKTNKTFNQLKVSRYYKKIIQKIVPGDSEADPLASNVPELQDDDPDDSEDEKIDKPLRRAVASMPQSTPANLPTADEDCLKQHRTAS